ncbi:hypothetical protein [Myceligenerans salitolerans]|uniref:Uncharacterized protein n=1 Tax=Myceligenerans salitolerans TaxID=1230528 RepID=A0ABS3IAD6_9MICO|nr:hypothetical protein [Myceligenerans salitolerans]MBO0609923.1 hypothetical protein [Myceligenerans salitolerans]
MDLAALLVAGVLVLVALVMRHAMTRAGLGDRPPRDRRAHRRRQGGASAARGWYR